MSRIHGILGLALIFLLPTPATAVPKDFSKQQCEHLKTKTVRDRCCDDHKRDCDWGCVAGDGTRNYECLDVCQIQMNVCKGKPESERPSQGPTVTAPKPPAGSAVKPTPRTKIPKVRGSKAKAGVKSK